MTRREYASYAADHDYVSCPKCGGMKTRNAELCRSCSYESRVKSWTACSECGKRIRQPATRCIACYDAGRAAKTPICVDCGKPTKQYAHDYYAQRCWSCEVLRRQSQPKRTCSMSGCQEIHSGKGLCRNHYSAQYKPRPRGALRGGRAKILLADWPCQICGYSRMKSDVHRILPGAEGGRYTVGNMVALCVRCHREVHRGLTATPNPPSDEEIRSFHPSA